MFHRLISFLTMLTLLAACVSESSTSNPTADWQAERLKQGLAAVEACRLSECTRLNLDGMRLDDYSALNDMPHVTKLMLSRTDIQDLSLISGMPQLQELHISWTDIDDLSGLAAFPKLRLLHANDLYQNPDPTPVHSLRGLAELSLGMREGDTLNFISNMRQLEKLYILNGEISDLAPLAGNRTIRELALPYGVPEDQLPLTRMPNISLIDVDEFVLDEDVIQHLEGAGVTVRLIPAVIVC